MIAAARTSVDRRGMWLLALGHMTVDSCQGAVPALLPFLVARRDYSYAAASGLVLAATVSSSVIQPYFGYHSDRRSLAWLLPVGPLLAGIGIALVGVTSELSAHVPRGGAERPRRGGVPSRRARASRTTCRAPSGPAA